MNWKTAGKALIVAIVVLGATTAGASSCAGESGSNGDSTPQKGHTTSVGPQPSSSARASIIPKGDVKPAYPDVIPTSQAEVDKWTKRHPTALCENGAFTWVMPESKACKTHDEIGVGEWYGGRPA